MHALDLHIRQLLAIDEMRQIDKAINGLQVGRRNKEINKLAVAVDACQETIQRAIDWNADVLFTHHGLFWGENSPITDRLYNLISMLIKNDVCLYAVHLPLDRSDLFGNNISIAQHLRLSDIKPFGLYRGIYIGYSGKFTEPKLLPDIIDQLFEEQAHPIATLPFGPEQITKVAIISGGAPFELEQAIEIGADLYITGDASHLCYHTAMEAKINVVFGGHYNTETWGVSAIGKHLNQEYNIDTTFIDVPTGL